MSSTSSRATPSPEDDNRANTILVVPTHAQLDSLQAAQNSTLRPYPFNQTQFTDITLVTSDNVELHASQMLLAYSSPIFRDMFLLPQPPASEEAENTPATTETTPKPQPVREIQKKSSQVTLPESSLVWDRLLHWIDPGQVPYTDSLDDISLVIDAVKKYYMGGIKSRICRFLLQSLHVPSADVMRIWAIAMRFGLDTTGSGHKHDDNEADSEHVNKLLIRDSAQRSLRFLIRERKSNPDLEFIPAGSYQRLQEYYIACGDAAADVALNIPQNEKLWSFVNDSTSWKGGPGTSEWSKVHSCTQGSGSSGSRNMPSWLQMYLRAVSSRVQDRPGGMTVEGIPDFFYEYAGSAIKCGSCNARNRFMWQFEGFNALLAEQIDAAIEKKLAAEWGNLMEVKSLESRIYVEQW
ncbi:hypothetical protein DL96DRAFT_1677409 [Flagelloscypha sp. PMI_526]|nr:hypothetical protein DL96DRAFT_1677409 [Flagelloscypha sp. PMI_526]